MLSIDQNHSLKYLIDKFDHNKWQFQYEKRHEIKDCLNNMLEIDNLFKHIRIHDPHLGAIFHNIEKEHFLRHFSSLVFQIIDLMKKEDIALEKIKVSFSGKQLSQIQKEENMEESAAEQMILWATRLRAYADLLYKQTKEHHLKELISRLSKIEKDMEWFEESLIEEHLNLLERGKDVDRKKIDVL